MGSIRIHNTANKGPHSHKSLWHPHLLDGLVEDEASGVIVDDSEAIPANVKNRSDRLSFRVLKKN